MDDLRELHVAAHPVAVVTEVDDVAVVQQPAREPGSHHFVVQDLCPVLGPPVGGQRDRRGRRNATPAPPRPVPSGGRCPGAGYRIAHQSILFSKESGSGVRPSLARALTRSATGTPVPSRAPMGNGTLPDGTVRTAGTACVVEPERNDTRHSHGPEKWHHPIVRQRNTDDRRTSCHDTNYGSIPPRWAGAVSAVRRVRCPGTDEPLHRTHAGQIAFRRGSLGLRAEDAEEGRTGAGQ